MLFAAIFITIAPVVAMLQAGLDGPLAPLLRLSQDGGGQPWPLAYFWLTGMLSAFLDNAPTYLVFFELAGIRPAVADRRRWRDARGDLGGRGVLRRRSPISATRRT